MKRRTLNRSGIIDNDLLLFYCRVSQLKVENWSIVGKVLEMHAVSYFDLYSPPSVQLTTSTALKSYPKFPIFTAFSTGKRQNFNQQFLYADRAQIPHTH